MSTRSPLFSPLPPPQEPVRQASDGLAPLGFAVRYAHLVADHVRTCDLDPGQVLAALGLSEDGSDALDPPPESPRWVPATRLAQALSVASDLCQDPHTALSIAQQIRPANMGALGYSLISCTGFADGLALFESLQSLVCTQVRAVHVRQGDKLRSHFELLGEVPRDTALWTFTLGTRLAFARWVSGRPLVPDAVWLPCPAPADPGPIRTWFGCPLHFNADTAGELAPAAWLALPNPHADAGLHRLMLAESTQHWARQAHDGGPLQALLRQHIATRLQTGQMPALKDISPNIEAELGVSARQLQRRLAALGLHFKDVVEQVRCEQVLHELRHTALPLADIAHRAAYAEPSSLHRAVRRWTGLTPLTVRQGKHE